VTLIDPPALSTKLGIPEATLSQWRYRSIGPAYIKVGRHVRYRDEDVDAWLDAQTRGGDGDGNRAA
jgi:predicted DNA-binding transcriptional regulator AlpA